MKQFIDANRNKKILPEDIASAAHICKSYAAILFRQTYGVTVTDYILSVRLGNAKKMLCCTDASGEIIAQSWRILRSVLFQPHIQEKRRHGAVGVP